MAFVAWSDAMSTGDDGVDEQHKSLIRVLNDLHDAMIGGQGGEKASQIVGRLAEYAFSHFTHEEELMAAAEVAGFPAHKMEHDDFRRRLELFSADAGRWGVFVSMDMIEFLRGWLIHHIERLDREDVGLAVMRRKSPDSQGGGNV